MSLQRSIDQEKIVGFCERWKIVELSLFGSVLRSDFAPESDVDALVSFGPEARWSLLDIVRMQDELAEILGRQVDLVERRAIEGSENYIRRKHILENLERVYVAR